MKTHLTIAEAAVLVRRDQATIYRWVSRGALDYDDTDAGFRVRADQVQRVAGKMRRGRPKRDTPA